MKHSFLKHSLLSLIIISGTLATGQIGAQGFTVVEVPFIFTYKKLVEVCDEQILTRFGAFFDRWIIEFRSDLLASSLLVLVLVLVSSSSFSFFLCLFFPCFLSPVNRRWRRALG